MSPVIRSHVASSEKKLPDLTSDLTTQGTPSSPTKSLRRATVSKGPSTRPVLRGLKHTPSGRENRNPGLPPCPLLPIPLERISRKATERASPDSKLPFMCFECRTDSAVVFACRALVHVEAEYEVKEPDQSAEAGSFASQRQVFLRHGKSGPSRPGYPDAGRLTYEDFLFCSFSEHLRLLQTPRRRDDQTSEEHDTSHMD